ncbi:MAG: tetratricopeptide repeat protein [Planctomycetota bacterium]|jgi:Tfp pilus assembly protein PilF
MVLAVVTVAAYWPVLGADFVHYDDGEYVTENQHVLGGLTLDGLKWSFTMDNETANWHPLTWMSHMLDCELFSENAGLHHLTSLIIHTVSAVLLLLVLASMTRRVWPSAFVAAAFALHPLHVESVAWIAERKDVLSGLFWMLTMACYLRYTRRGSRSSYILTLVVFGLGLMTKPMLVTLPFVLLLLDYWPLERLESAPSINRLRAVRPLIVEKIPFFILTGASCVVTYIAQKAGGAVVDIEALSFGARLSNALVSYVGYIVKMFWPVGLAVLYPFKHIPMWQAFSAFLGLVVITIAAILWGRRMKCFAVGWLWYIGTLVPVIGLVHVGSHGLADRYTYIPLIGIFIIVAFAVSYLCLIRPALRSAMALITLLLMTGMFAGTRNQVTCWKDSISLFRRAVEVTENNNFMHNNLAAELANVGQLDEAIVHLRLALQINPDIARAHNNLGIALATTGQLDEAIDCYRHAVHIDPKYASAYKNLGIALAATGHLHEGLLATEKALELAEAYGNEKLAQEARGLLKLFREARSDNEKPAINDDIAE